MPIIKKPHLLVDPLGKSSTIYYVETTSCIDFTTMNELKNWFHEFLPEIFYLDIICNGKMGSSGEIPLDSILGLQIDFSDQTLKRFCDHFENPDGKSKDSRFQLFYWHTEK